MNGYIRNRSATSRDSYNKLGLLFLIYLTRSDRIMQLQVESSRIVRPCYNGAPPDDTESSPLSVFDKVTFDTHIAIIYAYDPPNPPNSTLELGLRKVLSVYREFAGRLRRDGDGGPVILLNDEGVRFVEATVDFELCRLLPLKPSESILSFHPALKGAEELVQVQLTRFACGSLVVGFTAHHLVADGHSTSNFLVAWGQASRGVDISPLPFRDRTIFTPRQPPQFEFQHRGVEFIPRDPKIKGDHPCIVDDVIMHKAHFTFELLSKIKAKASSMNEDKKPYTTVESLVAHLWRCLTMARALNSFQTTHAKISVNGRARLRSKVPLEYFGNLVLWAFPHAKVKDLLREPLPYAAKLIHDAITKVDKSYFESFIDFATYKAEEEGLSPFTVVNKAVLCPDIDLDSWLRFPFYELDFGNGCPFIFMPSYIPVEGVIFLLPSFLKDGSIDVYVALSRDNLDVFEQVRYAL